MQAVAQSYTEVCQELGCQPLQQFLDCLQCASGVCQLNQQGFEHEAQAYALGSLLQYAALTELDVSGLRLDAAGWWALLEGVSQCTGLQVLSLKRCGLGNIDAQQLASCIGACRVAVLDVSQNGLADDWLLHLCGTPLITDGSGRLTSIDMSENLVTDDGAVVLAAALQAEGPHRQLKQLDLSFNRLEDRGAVAIAAMLRTVRLLALELEGNRIGDVGGQALAAAVRGASHLQRLNCNSNSFSGRTLVSMAEGLAGSQGGLQELAVAGASGSDAGDALCSLLRAAAGSRHLQLLDVRGVRLETQQVVEELCRLLGSAGSLVTLRLDVGSREAGEAVAQALAHGHTSLQHLMMGGPVPEHVLSFINAQLLSSNSIGRQQQQQQQQSSRGSPGSAAQGCTLMSQQQQQQQQQSIWSPSKAQSGQSGSPSRGSPGASSCRTFSPAGSRAQLTPPARPGSAGALCSSSARRSILTRSTTQQARRLSELDLAGLGGLAGGGAANKAAEVFRRHDSDGSGYLDAEEMMAALQDLNMLEGMKARQLGKFLSNAIREADTNQDGRVSLEEFEKYYERLARHYAEAARQGRICARRRPPAVPLDAAADQELKKVFKAYCRLRIGQGRQVGCSMQHINAAQFNQLCRDAGVLEPQGPLSPCAADIIFTRSKPPGSRRLAFKEFLEALAALAEEAGCHFWALTEALLAAGGGSASPGADGGADEFSAQAQLLAAAAARGSTATAHTRLSILDLTDTRLGPDLAGRSPRGTAGALTPGRDGSLQGQAAAAAAAAARDDGGVVRASLGSLGGPWKRQLLEALRALPDGASQHQQQQAVHNPLYEGEAEVPGSSSLKAKLLEGRLGVLQKMASSPAGRQEEGGIAASTSLPSDGELLPRLLLVEAGVAEQQQQLSAVAGQQDALREVVGRLVESLEAANLQAASGHRAELQQLSSQVQSLQAWKQATVERLQKADDRQMRVETAIYQVARQVDALDERLRAEQDTSLKALEAILAHASPLKLL